MGCTRFPHSAARVACIDASPHPHSLPAGEGGPGAAFMEGVGAGVAWMGDCGILVARRPDAAHARSPSPLRREARARPVACRYNQNPSFQRMIRVLLSPQGRRIRLRGVETPSSSGRCDRKGTSSTFMAGEALAYVQGCGPKASAVV